MTSILKQFLSDLARGVPVDRFMQGYGLAQKNRLAKERSGLDQQKLGLQTRELDEVKIPNVGLRRGELAHQGDALEQRRTEETGQNERLLRRIAAEREQTIARAPGVDLQARAEVFDTPAPLLGQAAGGIAGRSRGRLSQFEGQKARARGAAGTAELENRKAKGLLPAGPQDIEARMLRTHIQREIAAEEKRLIQLELKGVGSKARAAKKASMARLKALKAQRDAAARPAVGRDADAIINQAIPINPAPILRGGQSQPTPPQGGFVPTPTPIAPSIAPTQDNPVERIADLINKGHSPDEAYQMVYGR